MKRESRYLVLKFSDILDALTGDEINTLQALANKVEATRVRNGKRPFKCVCIEDDWEPEYEQAWKLIEEREKRLNND